MSGRVGVSGGRRPRLNRQAPGRVVSRTARDAVRRVPGSDDRVEHSGLMEELAHWLGVALATPVAGVIFLASWRAFAWRRTRRLDSKESL
jgi:hypothetical protein